MDKIQIKWNLYSLYRLQSVIIKSDFRNFGTFYGVYEIQISNPTLIRFIMYIFPK